MKCPKTPAGAEARGRAIADLLIEYEWRAHKNVWLCMIGAVLVGSALWAFVETGLDDILFGILRGLLILAVLTGTVLILIRRELAVTFQKIPDDAEAPDGMSDEEIRRFRAGAMHRFSLWLLYDLTACLALCAALAAL